MVVPHVRNRPGQTHQLACECAQVGWKLKLTMHFVCLWLLASAYSCSFAEKCMQRCCGPTWPLLHVLHVCSHCCWLRHASGTLHLRILLVGGKQCLALCWGLSLTFSLCCVSLHCCCRLAPTCEWDTAAADIIVREAGGVVLYAGACDNEGKALEDWRVGVAMLDCGR